MNPPIQIPEKRFDFRTKSTLGISVIVLFLLTPLSFNHFIKDRYTLGVGTLVIVLLFAINVWNCSRGRYNSLLTLVALSPVIVLILVFSFRDMGIMGALWCYPAVLVFYFMLPERQAWIVNTTLLAIIIPQGWTILENQIALRLTATLIAVSTFSAIFVRVIADQQHKLETQVVTDHLTGLYNRTLLNDSLEHAVQQFRRRDAPMTLVALDLDHFKTINDTFGHDAGDTVLQGIGKLLRERIRRSDKVFRIGGEEFIALLYDTDEDHGQKFAEELRSTIESLQLIPDHKVTTSIGVATLQTDENRDLWMKRCDKNLYEAKLNGRNLVVV